MNREIKFKSVYKKYNSGELFVGENTWGIIKGSFASPSSYSHAERIRELQYTGLKDKNGKEIYEGDIVESEIWVSIGNYERCTGVVKYKNCGFTIECTGDWVGSNADLNRNATVIGNIFENSELLTNVTP